MVHSSKDQGVVIAAVNEEPDSQDAQRPVYDNDDMAETRMLPSQRYVLHSFDGNTTVIYDRELCYHHGRRFDGAEGWNTAIQEIKRLNEEDQEYARREK